MIEMSKSGKKSPNSQLKVSKMSKNVRCVKNVNVKMCQRMSFCQKWQKVSTNVKQKYKVSKKSPTMRDLLEMFHKFQRMSCMSKSVKNAKKYVKSVKRCQQM